MATSSDAPHLPRSAPIEAYGKGGFAFADMSHRGSLLCLPDAIWAWNAVSTEPRSPKFTAAYTMGTSYRVVGTR